VTHGASGDVPVGVLQSSRGWDDGQWNAALVTLRQRGWLADGDDLVLTAWGAAQRQEIEDQTDTLAAAPYVGVGEEACGELRALTRPWSRVFAEVLFVDLDGSNAEGATRGGVTVNGEVG
jgi:hypothetical protein